MRRSDRAITAPDEIATIIRGSDVCRLGCAVGDEPYIVPVSFGFDGQDLFFHTATAGRKIDIWATNPRVCFELEADVELVRHPQDACRWTFNFASVIGYGTVHELLTTGDKIRGLNHIMEHYSGKSWPFDAAELSGTRVWRLAVESVTGKRARQKQD